MSVNIGPKIYVDGEAEYRKQINEIIQSQRTLKSEMKMVAAEFDDNDDSMEKLSRQSQVLTKQIEKQKQRLELLETMLKKSADKYGDADKNTQRWQEAVNDATTDLIKMERELDDMNAAMEAASSEMSQAESDAEDFADALEEVTDAAKDGGDGFTIMKGAAADLVAGGIKTMAGEVVDLAKDIVNLAEETEEYRTMQAKMSGSAKSFGYSMSFVKDQYKEFYKYLGDDQMSTNAITNLLGMQVTTDTVSESARAAIAVWTAYGDSIPIESLTESFNESAQVAQVTGVLADALNWAGISEDDFNLKLQALTSTQERADLIAQTLNDTYGDSKQTYDDMTEGIQNANSAEAELKETQAELGEAIEPVREALTKLKTQGLELIAPVVEWVGGLFESFGENINEAREEIFETIEDSEDLRKSLKETADELADSSDAVKELMDEMKSGKTSTNALVKELEKLAGKTERTADEQYELESIVTALNGMFPELALSIDETSGSLNQGTEEIQKFISEAENTQLATEAQSEYTKAVENLTAAEEARRVASEAGATVTAERIEKEAEIQTILDAQTEKTNALKAAQDAYSEALRTGKGDLDALYLATQDTGEAMVEYQGQMMTASEAFQIANNELAMLKDEEQKHMQELAAQDEKIAQSKAVLDEYSTTIGANATATDQATQATTGYQTGTQATIIEVGRAMEAFNNLSKSQQQTALDLEASVTAMQESMQSTIQSQMDMFSAFDASIDLTTQDLLANMQSQVDGVTAWEENIIALSDTAINQNLLQHLMEMGPSGAGYVELFANMTDEEMQEANELWSEALDIQGMTNDWGEQLTTIGAENIAAGMDGITELMEESGADTVMGLVNGIQSAKEEAEAAGVDLGESTVDSVNEGSGVASPSWKTKESGQYVDQGMINGINAYKPRVLSSAKEMAQSTIQTIARETGTQSGASTKTKTYGQRTGQGIQTGLTASRSSVMQAARNVSQAAISSMSSGLNSGKPTVIQAARDLAQSTISAMQINTQSLYNSGYNASMGLANGIYAGRSEVINAASSVAASAIQAAQSTLQIHSPSRVFWGMGENSMNAYAGGFVQDENKLTGEIIETLQFSMANAAAAIYGAQTYEAMTGAIIKAISAGLSFENGQDEQVIIIKGDTIELDGNAVAKGVEKRITLKQTAYRAARGGR